MSPTAMALYGGAAASDDTAGAFLCAASSVENPLTHAARSTICEMIQRDWSVSMAFMMEDAAAQSLEAPSVPPPAVCLLEEEEGRDASAAASLLSMEDVSPPLAANA